MSNPDAGYSPAPFGCSVQGEAHVRRGLPCQDAYALRVAALDAVVLAVADGLGSASRSEEGARIAVAAAAEAAAAACVDSTQLDAASAALQAVRCARRALEIAASEECGLSDLACTLIVVVACGDHIGVAHIGDGAVVGRTPTGLLVLSPPDNSEYANEVCPLTADRWSDAVRTGGPFTDVDAVASFTDGLQRSVLTRREGLWSPFAGFFTPLFEYAATPEAAVEGAESLRRVLQSPALCAHSDDDKTLAVVCLATTQRCPG